MECQLVRCQQERRFIRREFGKWTKNLLLQIGLETISKNYLQFEINSFDQKDDEEKIPKDFHPDPICLFCINRQECSSKKTNLPLNNHINPIEINDEDENRPLDLSLKTTSHSNSSRLSYEMPSDIYPRYNSEEFLSSNQMNFNYLSQSFPNFNPFPSLSFEQYQFNSSLTDHYVSQLAKQMAYVRMMQELENHQNHKNIKETVQFLNTPSVLTESMHVNQLITDIMTRTLHEIYEEQTKQPKRVSKQGELLYVKKQTNHQGDTTIFKSNKQSKPGKKKNPSPSSSSSTSSISSNCSPSIHHPINNKSKSNPSPLSHVSNRRQKEMIANNSKVLVGNDGKQIRPKRGQYRRYESEQLAKAVSAVLSNEMSVHKAGSYFGVPHSTLEYKVKERHSKISTAKTKNDQTSSSIQFLSNNNDTIQNESMDSDNIDENEKLSPLIQAKNGREHSIDDVNEEIPSTNLIALEMK